MMMLHRSTARAAVRPATALRVAPKPVLRRERGCSGRGHAEIKTRAFPGSARATRQCLTFLTSNRTLPCVLAAGPGG